MKVTRKKDVFYIYIRQGIHNIGIVAQDNKRDITDVSQISTTKEPKQRMSFDTKEEAITYANWLRTLTQDCSKSPKKYFLIDNVLVLEQYYYIKVTEGDRYIGVVSKKSKSPYVSWGRICTTFTEKDFMQIKTEEIARQFIETLTSLVDIWRNKHSDKLDRKGIYEPIAFQLAYTGDEEETPKRTINKAVN